MKLTFPATLLFPFAVLLAQGQVRSEFEVASVKIVPPGNNTESYMPTLDVAPGGTLRISNRRLDEIIMLANATSASSNHPVRPGLERMTQQLDAGMSRPTMFAPVEKLGLNLDKKRESAEMLIVDRCEQASTEN